MMIDRASEFVPGTGTLYSFTISDRSMIIWSGHGFVTARSRDQAANIARAELVERRRSHPMIRRA